MKKKLMAGLTTGLLVLGIAGMANATPVQWTTSSGGNGHWYDVVDSTLSWDQAKLAAEGAGGYLATITTANEQQFIASLVTSHVPANNGTISGYMLGGFQPVGSPEPNGNWQWVTSEAWSYTNWGSIEPNNAGAENFLYLDERYQWAWNDYTNNNNWYGQPSGYIVESAPVPEPATMLLVGIGLGGLMITRRKKNA